ncbi:MAG: RNA methyltransferase [Tannerellaceae bacterium]|jgi:TrmH family RNA methyltransferase|nr:RNA methyltransferase [Tannerellaceae bacterium]
MISSRVIKYIRSLEKKRNRIEQGVFLAEGNKLVTDLCLHFYAELVIAKPVWIATQGNIAAKELLVADEADIRRASFLRNPQDVIAAFRLPMWQIKAALSSAGEGELILALDGIQDPGNLGTIIRLASWFGIPHLLCSEDTTDVFNPKSIQATMGALVNVEVHYCRLEEQLEKLREQGVPLFGASLNGEPLFDAMLGKGGVLVVGNEGQGIRPAVRSLLDRQLYIPRYATEAAAESLNVAVATGILCAEFRRKNIE